MNLAVVKLGINLLSSFGVSKVLNDIVSHNTTVVTTADAILVKTGTLVLGTMIVGHASNHVNNTIDGVVAIFNKKDDDGGDPEDGKAGTDEPKAYVPPTHEVIDEVFKETSSDED